MKYLIGSLLLIAGCTGGKEPSALPGTYISSFENEFSISEDTFFLTKTQGKSDLYEIEKHAGVVRKKNNEKLPKEVKSENWMLEFDPAKNTLFEKKKGKTLIWDKENQTIQLGKLTYRRIRD